MFVNCLVNQFAMCLGVVAVLLLNVMDVFSEGGGALLDGPYMVFHRMCVLCLCFTNYYSKINVYHYLLLSFDLLMFIVEYIMSSIFY